ncbi:MAG TPA: ATP-binding protein, partial [Limnobacter sp.]|nr:ATP-binding protein [Limnobacter sp.]
LRIVQEIFTNMLKHSKATEVSLVLARGPNYVGVQIRDNGVGFDLDKSRLGRGLKNMSQRAATLGGSLQIETQPGSGAVHHLKLPL